MIVTKPPTHIFFTVQTVTNILLIGTTELIKHGNEETEAGAHRLSRYQRKGHRPPRPGQKCVPTGAIKRARTRSTAARQVSNAYERDLVTNQNV